MLISQLTSIFVPSVYAASSPWSQTNWNGGSGQTSWSDTTKYDSSSSVTTSTANQVTLTQTSSWYNASWAYRKKITFDNSAQAENLTNFPVLVKLTSSNINYSNTQDSGQDIRFTDSDGTTALSYEIEKWDETGTSYVWVKVPQIDASSATDNIYMYYGNTSATDGQSATSVWDSNHVLVQHLAETSGTTTNDSTSNNNDGTKVSATEPNPTTSGQIDGAQTFDGINDRITAGNAIGVQISSGTIEAWIKTSNAGNNFRGIIAKQDAYGMFLFNNVFTIYDWGTPATRSSGINLADNIWHHVVVTFQSGITDGTVLYIDGVSRLTTTMTIASQVKQLMIGEANASQWFAGSIDEARVSNSVRSAAWIAASYKSEADTFNTFASEEGLYGVGSGTLTSSIFDAEQASDWGNLTYSATIPSNTSVSVKVRSSNSSTMSGATDFSSCTAISSGTDLSSNPCITDGHRYIQYQISLSNTDNISTPTFEDISIAFTKSTFSLDSPGDNSYTNSERLSFKWRAVSDTGGLSKYVLEVDNPSAGSGQASGDFTIDDIPLSRTSDLETNKYTVKYENFSDSDDTNNYISIATKSHADWSSAENDGKLREGKVSWKVKAVGGNETSLSRTLFVDRTFPNAEFSQINSTPYTSSNFSTTDKTPTIFGKITDPLSGGDTSKTQDENGPKVASGPKEVNIKVEKKTGVTYELVTLYKINMDSPYYTCDTGKTIDNSKQKCDKYLPFEYTPEENLDYGTYKITLSGKDKADNSSSEVTLTLNITTLSQITTPEEKKVVEEKEQKKEELEITKPTEEVPVSELEKAGEGITQAGKNFFDGLGTLAHNIITGVGNGIAFTFNSIGNGLAFVFDEQVLPFWNKTGQGLAFIFTKTGEGLAFVGNGISNTVGNTASVIGDGYNNIAEHAPGVTKNILLALGNGVSTVGTGIGNGFSAVGTTTNSVADATGNFIESTANDIGTGVHDTGTAIAQGFNNTKTYTQSWIATLVFTVGEKTQNVSDTTGIAIMRFGSQFVTEPTRIYDVKVAKSTPTSMTIAWETNHPANGKVNYGLTPDYGQDVQAEKRITHHEFTVTGLEPNTTYFYEVMSHNKNYVYDANHTFTTPAE